MCFGMPGRIVAVDEPATEPRMATVDVGGSDHHVCLAFTPEADVGDHVIVHAGFAVHQLSAGEASRMADLLRAAGGEP